MTQLRDAPARIVIECSRCGRHGEYSRARALKQFGNISLEDFVFRVASAECALMKAPNGATRCGARSQSRSQHAA